MDPFVVFLVILMCAAVVFLTWMALESWDNHKDKVWHENNARMFSVQAHEALYGDRDKE